MQGLKFEFEDGTVEAFGMEINDETDVTELEVPKGQHIKDVVLRSEKYINQIGFTTNEGRLLGPVGGNGGKRSYGQFYYYTAAQKYLHDIKGTTVIGDDGEPFIAEFEFRYIYLI